MKIDRVLVFGATGLVGGEVLRQLENSGSAKQVYTLTRRPHTSANPKFKNFVAEFNALSPDLECFAVDAVICAIGTTIKKAGSQEAFRKVDYQYPMTIAKLAKNAGAKHFFLVSALGADAKSKIFYNRTKGELERDLEKLGFDSLVIVRPSVLVGEREEVRIAEKISQKIGAYLPCKWRAVPAKNVAAALLASLEKPKPGMQIIENEGLFS